MPHRQSWVKITCFIFHQINRKRAFSYSYHPLFQTTRKITLPTSLLERNDFENSFRLWSVTDYLYRVLQGLQDAEPSMGLTAGSVTAECRWTWCVPWSLSWNLWSHSSGPLHLRTEKQARCCWLWSLLTISNYGCTTMRSTEYIFTKVFTARVPRSGGVGHSPFFTEKITLQSGHELI